MNHSPRLYFVNKRRLLTCWQGIGLTIDTEQEGEPNSCGGGVHLESLSIRIKEQQSSFFGKTSEPLVKNLTAGHTQTIPNIWPLVLFFLFRSGDVTVIEETVILFLPKRLST